MIQKFLSCILILGFSLLYGCGGGGGEKENSESGGPVVTEQRIASSSNACPNGGFSLDIGIDINGNGTLDSDEVDRTELICNGKDSSALLNIIDENPGDNCFNGGKKLETGIDGNSNGILESDEIQRNDFVCNGLDSYPMPNLEGNWAITSYNNGFTGETGIINFNSDGTFDVEGGTAGVIVGCGRLSCSGNHGTWDYLEDDILSVTLENQNTSFLVATNSNRNQVTFIRSLDLSVFKKVESPKEIPVANAGEDFVINLGDSHILNGTSSYDNNDDKIVFKWKNISRPNESNEILLSDVTSPQPLFTPDAGGEYVFSLIVNDGEFWSIADTVTIKVNFPWKNLTEEFDYSELFYAETLSFFPNTDKTVLSNSYLGQHGSIILDYTSKKVAAQENQHYSSFSLAVDPRDSKHYVKFQGYEVWESKDAGLNWSQISSPNTFGVSPNVKYLEFSPDGEALYLYSNDRGSSVSSSGWLFSLSLDGGVTWNLPTNLLEGRGYGPLEISEQDPNTVYLRSNIDLYKSSDRGLTWEIVPSFESYSYPGTQGLKVDPCDANTIFAVKRHQKLTPRRHLELTPLGWG